MMSEEQKLIDRYLHGELDDAEQESLEERFFVDDDLFEQIEVAEMRLIDSYVRGEMDGAARERFESGYLTTPERSAKVAKAEVFHREIAKMKPAKESWFTRLLEGFSFSLSVPQMATVATILLLAIGAFWVFRILQSDLPDVAEGNVNIPIGPIDTNVQTPVEMPPGPEATPREENRNGTKPGASPTGTPENKRPSIFDLMPPGGNDPTYTSRDGTRPTIVRIEAWNSEAENTFVPVSLVQDASALTLILPVTGLKESSRAVIIVERVSGERVLSESGRRPEAVEGKAVFVINLSTEKLAQGRYLVKVVPEKGQEIRYGFEIAKGP